MKDYILISQQQHHVMQYIKTNAGWLLSEYETADASISLGSVDLELELAEIYTNVDFENTK